jgi:hypothetical protein
MTTTSRSTSTLLITFGALVNRTLSSTSDGERLNIVETIVRNGSWKPTTEKHPHIHLDSLALQMPDMHYFTQNCQYQYFMTVFKTDNMDEEQVTKQSEKKWESKSASNVVMRSVGFGKTMPENTSVCAKRQNYQGERGDLKEKELKGLREDLLVPLALMIALRRHSKDAYCWQSLI